MSLPFTVIGGYLGAGKTSLLNDLLSNAGAQRIAVLVNDFGSVNIDVALVRNRDGDTIELSNGCMCCSLADGFSGAIDRLSRRAADFDHVVIEASGVAYPARIAHLGETFGLNLNAIIVMVDAERIKALAADKFVGATIRGQLAQADLLVLNKTDLLDPHDCRNVHGWLVRHNGQSPVIDAVRGQVPLDVMFGAHMTPGVRRAGNPSRFQADHAAGFGTWTLEHEKPVTRAAMGRFAAGLGPDIYRAKGFASLLDEPACRYVYQQVGARWSLEDIKASDATPAISIVVIGRAGATTIAALERLLGVDSVAR